MHDPSKSKIDRETPANDESILSQLRSEHRSINADEAFKDALRQIPDRLEKPSSHHRSQVGVAPGWLMDFTPGQWMIVAAACLVFVASGIVWLVRQNDPQTDANQRMAGDSRDFAPRQGPTPQNSNAENDVADEHSPIGDQLSYDLAVARLVFEQLNQRDRGNAPARLRELRKERVSREENWERVAATLTYAADYETQQNQSRSANANMQKSNISPLYQVVIELAPSSHWSDEAKAKLEMQ